MTTHAFGSRMRQEYCMQPQNVETTSQKSWKFVKIRGKFVKIREKIAKICEKNMKNYETSREKKETTRNIMTDLSKMKTCTVHN